MSHARRNAVLLLHGIVFIWGFTGILGKLIQQDALQLVYTRTAIAVDFARISGSRLGPLGAWWLTTTNAMPLFAGSDPSSSRRGGRAPAEPPIPTITGAESGGRSGLEMARTGPLARFRGGLRGAFPFAFTVGFYRTMKRDTENRRLAWACASSRAMALPCAPEPRP